MDIYAPASSQCGYRNCREEHMKREVPLMYVRWEEECDQN